MKGRIERLRAQNRADAESMGHQIEKLRAASVVSAMHEVRRFRHFARHGYGADFDWSRLEANRKLVLANYEALANDLLAFDNWLSAVSDASG